MQELKCILYISQVESRRNGATIPIGLGNISTVAKVKNLQHQISGFLSYRKGLYLQMIEGEPPAVDKLFSNIERDARHLNVVKLVDSNISDRYFDSWSTDLSISLNEDHRFTRFVTDHLQKISSLGKMDQELFQQFFKSKILYSQPSSLYANQSISLTEWPDFTQVEQSSSNFKFCYRLVSGPVRYEQLVQEFSDKTDSLLNLFKDMNILKLGVQGEDLSQKSSGKFVSKFYQKMVGFLDKL